MTRPDRKATNSNISQFNQLQIQIHISQLNKRHPTTQSVQDFDAVLHPVELLNQPRVHLVENKNVEKYA